MREKGEKTCLYQKGDLTDWGVHHIIVLQKNGIITAETSDRIKRVKVTVHAKTRYG